MANFNAFEKAKFETKNNYKIPKKIKERKEQMSIMLTPTNKEKIRSLADEANMSVSELIAYWLEQSLKN
ncbi:MULTISPECIES: hypothetical protein [Lactococcus]|uniref:CopG family transcriptional regulator n=1 Tax=Lactococcus lactis subsp. cremoris TaxID=1359 RepID=A0ABR5EIS6_LACLC|nr:MULTISPECIES: hypothetical protein [Lactococcus]KKW74480.1 hypothetical protein VN93_0523 [Lactococcus cremoris]KKW74674.1 hypothetical protein VN93_0364 [Lactococcus cremoris]MCG3097454.1 hypothetical protein [Lactococcus petauri]MCT0080102.1 hypothetical protein [Lactococcus lactis subsp. lactis]MCT0476554.1 hypothetical protein [Lactococcus cremoris]